MSSYKHFQLELNIIGVLLKFFNFMFITLFLMLKILFPNYVNKITYLLLITYPYTCVFQNNIPKLSLAVRLPNAVQCFFCVFLFVLICFNLS